MVAMDQQESSMGRKTLYALSKIWDNITIIAVVILTMVLLMTLDYNNALETKIQIDHVRYNSRITDLEIKADSLQEQLDYHLRDVASNSNGSK
jgi:hypothetical protein